MSRIPITVGVLHCTSDKINGEHVGIQNEETTQTVGDNYEGVNENVWNDIECDTEACHSTIPKRDLFTQFESISLDPQKNLDCQEELNLLNDDADDTLPLKGTVVFVDVRAENENRSKAISREVERLGSVVVTKINSMVTHVVFKDGRSGTISQVKKYPHIHVVSVLWVDSCKTTSSRVDESKYSIEFPENLVLPSSRVKRVKSLQPKTLEEDVNESGKKAERRRKRLRSKKMEETPPDHIICIDSQEYIKSSDLYKMIATPRIIPDTPWIFDYINSSSRGETYGDDSDSTIIHKADGSFDASDSFTKIIPLSPSTEPKKYNTSLLQSFTIAKRSTDLQVQESKVINSSGAFHDTKDDTVNDDKITTTPVKEYNIPTVDQNIDFNEKTPSLIDVPTTLKIHITKKKKKLFSKTIPFNDSPFEGEEVDNGNPSTVQYPKSIRKGNVIDPFLAMRNVETSRKLIKLRKQKKHLLKPFQDSPDCSFKTVESLQLRCPTRKGHTKTGITKGDEECTDLICDMNGLKVNFDISCVEEERKKKDNIYRQKIKQRKSSGVDFKITKNIKSASLHNKNKQCVNKSRKKNVYYSDSTSPCSSDSDDTESIASNLSFIHDADEGLIIRSQDSHVSQDVAEVMDIVTNVDSDSGISDTGVGCIKGDINKNSIKSSHQPEKSKRNAKYKGKSPKSRSRSRHFSPNFSPYKSMKVKSSIVSTSLHLGEQTFLKAMLKKLGGYIYRTNVANDTTHVIAGSDRRTLNILYAIVYGCWILSPKWVADSAEEGKWLKEVDYEMHTEFPIAKFSRISRIRDGKSVVRNLFTLMPLIYIADVTIPPSDELVKLVTLGGGQVTNSIRKAGIVVGIVKSRRKDLRTVTERWVLDSISKGSILPTEGYLHSMIMENREGSPGF